MRKRRPPFRRRKLAKKLRKMRLRARMSIQEAAKALDKDVQALYRIESGETGIDVHFGRSVMDVYDAYDPELLHEIRAAARRGWWTTYGIKDQGYIDVETEAAVVREFSLTLVPGLLQISEYMTAVFAAHEAVPNMESHIEVRQIRQRRLTETENSLRLHVIIDEQVLRRNVGGAEVMRAQLLHLIESAVLPNVTMQIITCPAHAAMMGAFSILEFPDPDDPPVFYLEYPTGSIHVEDPEQLRRSRLVLDRLAAEALSPEESVAFIERVLDE